MEGRSYEVDKQRASNSAGGIENFIVSVNVPQLHFTKVPRSNSRSDIDLTNCAQVSASLPTALTKLKVLVTYLNGTLERNIAHLTPTHIILMDLGGNLLDGLAS